MDSMIKPKLIYFVRKKCNSSWKIDYEQILFNDLLFILDGSVDYIINGTLYHAQKGDIVLIKSKSYRSATTQGMLCAAFDFHMEEGDSINLPIVTFYHDFENFQWLFQELDFEWSQKKEGYQLKCQALFALILHKLLFEDKHNQRNAHVEIIKRYIVQHYDEELKVKTLAKVANLHPVYCGALFNRLENRTISEFINLVRINKAAALLETGEYNVGEVAEKTGFNDIYYFSNTFKRFIGTSPSFYKNKFASARTLSNSTVNKEI